MKLIEFNPVKRASAEDALCSSFFETQLDPILINRNLAEDDANKHISISVDQIPVKINLNEDHNTENTKKYSNMNSIDSNDQNKSPLKIALENPIIPENLVNDKIGIETPLFIAQNSATSDKIQSLLAKDKIMDQDSLYLDISLPLLTGNLNTLYNDSKTGDFNSFNNFRLNMGASSPTKSKFSTESPVNIGRLRRKSTNDENLQFKASILKSMKCAEIDDKIIILEASQSENFHPINILNSGKLEKVSMDDQKNNNNFGGFSDVVKQYYESIDNIQINQIKILKDDEKVITHDIKYKINSNNIINPEIQFSNIPLSKEQQTSQNEDNQKKNPSDDSNCQPLKFE